MFFNVNKETPTTQHDTNPPMPATSSTVLLFSFSSEEAAPLTTRTFRLAMFLDDDFACRFADEEEEEEKRKRVCDWETEEIEDSAIRCIMNLYIYIYCLCACAFYGAFPRECVCFCFRARKVIPVSDIQIDFCNEQAGESNLGFQNSRHVLEHFSRFSSAHSQRKKKKKKNDALVTDG